MGEKRINLFESRKRGGDAAWVDNNVHCGHRVFLFSVDPFEVSFGSIYSGRPKRLALPEDEYFPEPFNPAGSCAIGRYSGLGATSIVRFSPVASSAASPGPLRPVQSNSAARVQFSETGVTVAQSWRGSPAWRKAVMRV